MKASIEWTPERVEKLKELCAQNLSAAKIGRILGVTRNAALGKSRRMGFEMRGDIAWNVSRAPKQKPATAPAPKPRPAVVKEKPEPVTFIGPLETSTGPGTCQYIAGDTHQPGWQMCGNPVAKLGTSWCPYHASICFDPPRTETSRKKVEAAPDKAEAA